MTTRVILFLLLIFSITNAEIKYVSKTGSSTPPYTSWATAADSIYKAMDISVYGDTVYLGPGIYKDTVIVPKGVSFIGTNMDSCIIDTRDFPKPDYFHSVRLLGDNTAKNLNIIVDNNKKGWGLTFYPFEYHDSSKAVISNNKITNGYSGIYSIGREFVIDANIVQNCEFGIRIQGYEYSGIIRRNKICASDGIRTSPGGQTLYIHNNEILLTDYGGYGIHVISYQAQIKNNLIYTSNIAMVGINNVGYPVVTENNVIYGKFWFRALLAHWENLTRNNLIINSIAGLSSANNNSVQYNVMWNCEVPFVEGTFDSTNRVINPMVADTSALDFHLQKYSPLIDAGAPYLHDKDGSRSDIGLFGGEYGDSYPYINLPPSAPRIDTSGYNNGYNFINWLDNTESDVVSYKAEREVIAGRFGIDNKKCIHKADTSLTEPVNGYGTIRYLLTAIDNEGYESDVSPVDISVPKQKGNNKKATKNRLRAYPNPFNPEIIVTYELESDCDINLTLWSLTGEKIKEIEKGKKGAGNYESRINGDEMELSAGVYFLRLNLANETGKREDFSYKIIYLK